MIIIIIVKKNEGREGGEGMGIWPFLMEWTSFNEKVCQRSGKLSQKETVLASFRTVSAPLNHAVFTAISSSCTTQITLPVTNSQEELIELVSAKKLGTTASPEEEAGSGPEKEKNDSGGSNQWGWHFMWCKIEALSFYYKTVMWMFTCCGMLLTRHLLTWAKGLSFIPLKCTKLPGSFTGLFASLPHALCTHEHIHTDIHTYRVNKSVCQHRWSRTRNRGIQYADCETITGLLSPEDLYLFQSWAVSSQWWHLYIQCMDRRWQKQVKVHDIRVTPDVKVVWGSSPMGISSSRSWRPAAAD